MNHLCSHQIKIHQCWVIHMGLHTRACVMQWTEPLLWRNSAQATSIFWGTYMYMSCCSLEGTATAYRFLSLSIFLLQDNCFPMVGVQILLKPCNPRMQLSTACSDSIFIDQSTFVRTGTCLASHSMQSVVANSSAGAKLKIHQYFFSCWLRQNCQIYM